MGKKKMIALVAGLQIITLLLSAGITWLLVRNDEPDGKPGLANEIRGKIVFIGAPIQDAQMEDSYIVYVQEDGNELLTTILITPDTWLFDGQGGAIWEKCLNFETSVNDYLKTGVEIEAQIYAPDSSISDRHVLLYPVRKAEIIHPAE